MISFYPDTVKKFEICFKILTDKTEESMMLISAAIVSHFWPILRKKVDLFADLGGFVTPPQGRNETFQNEGLICSRGAQVFFFFFFLIFSTGHQGALCFYCTIKKKSQKKKQNYHQSQKISKMATTTKKLQKHITEIYIKRTQSTEPSTC